MRRWAEHTGEVELEIEAAGEAEAFAEALAGLAELLGGEPGAGRGPEAERRCAVRAEGADREALLVAWLEELLWIAERDGVVPARVARLELGDAGLRAEVLARPVPPRPLVKGVTWHRLRFERRGDGVRARVVLDV